MVVGYEDLVSPDFRNRYEDKYYGKYRGLVVDNLDPAKLGRIKVEVNAVLGNQELCPTNITDWIWPSLPAGGNPDLGTFWVPDIGSQVWVEFEQGNINFPIWVGTVWAKPTKTSKYVKVIGNEVPKLAQGGDAGKEDASTKSPKGDDTAQTAPIPSALTIQEPSSPYKAEYPNNRVMKTTRGMIVEFDDTPGEERIHVYHPKGTYIEIDKDGNTTMRIMGNLYTVVVGDHDTHVKGNMNLVVDGNRTTKVGGSLSVEVAGDKLQTIEGSVKEVVLAGGAGPKLTVLPGIQQIVMASKTEEIKMNKDISIGINELAIIGVSRIEQIGVSDTRVVGVSIRDQAPRIDHN